MSRKKDNFIPPSVATDVVIFTIIDDELNVLTVERTYGPEGWSLPGGFVGEKEDLEEAAQRTLFEKTGVKDVYLEQLYTFGDPKRDPRGRVISIAYFALVSAEAVSAKNGKDTKGLKWQPLKKIPKLAFDHNEILSYATKRLVWKMEYTNVVYSLLPKYFSLTDLQKVYEIVLGRDIDKRNFRRKILSTGMIKATKMKEGGAHRPAIMYQFTDKDIRFISNPFGQFLKK
ncbi:MAG: NUDIX domain-containing protein [bacterium]|nr:NUDIX domain-containing protein [bacterium]